MWPINPNVLRERLDPERVKKAVIIVRNAVALVNGDIDLICSLHQIQRVDLEADLGITSQQFWIHLFDIGVGTVAANTVSIEHPDPKNKVLGSLMRAHSEAGRHRIPGVKAQCGPAAPVEKADFRDLDIARSPSSFDRLEHVHRSIGFSWTFGGNVGRLSGTGDPVADVRLLYGPGRLVCRVMAFS